MITKLDSVKPYTPFAASKLAHITAEWNSQIFILRRSERPVLCLTVEIQPEMLFGDIPPTEDDGSLVCPSGMGMCE